MSMIEFVRKRRKGFINFILLGFAVILMVSFGLESFMYQGPRKQKAISVNGEEISRMEFDTKLRSVEQFYRNQFKGAYEKFAAQLNLPQKIADQIIEERLLGNFLDSLGFTASVPQIESRIAQLPYFGGKVDQDTYNSYLRGTRQTEASLQRAMQKEVIDSEIQNTLVHLVPLTKEELKVIYQHDNESAKFVAAKFSSDDFVSKASASEEELKDYFSKHQSEYINPKNITVEFLKITPGDVKSKVAVREEDLRQLYEERKDTLKEEESFLLSKISFNVAPEGLNSEEAAMESKLSPRDKSRQQAQGVIDRFKKGEAFDALAQSLSEDADSKSKGGDIGWKKASDLNDEIAAQLDGVKAGEVSPMVEEADETAVYLVREHKPSREKPFDEVRAQLEDELRLQDAPIYLEQESDVLLTKLESGEETLEKIANARSFNRDILRNISAHDGRIPAELSEDALQGDSGGVRRVHVGDDVYFYKVSDVVSEKNAEFSEVRAKIEEKIKKNKSEVLAREKADELLIAQPTPENFRDKIKEFGGTLIESELKKASEQNGEFVDSRQTTSSLYALKKEKPLYPKVVTVGDTSYVVLLTEKTEPDLGGFDKDRTDILTREANATGTRLLDSLVRVLKGESEISVDPEILNSSES